MKKEIILVGTFHFEQDEELIKAKELEVIELVEHLSKLKPTKIAVEWDANKSNQLNKEYKNSNGNYTISEIQQIGFRLAETLKHQEIFAVNWAGNLENEDVINLNNSIKESYPELLNTMTTLSENSAVLSPTTRLMTSFEKLNDKESIEELERMYLSFVIVDNPNGERVGVNFLNKWMERELMIFKNIVETTSNSHNERILLLIGSDHLWMLSKLFEGKGWKVIAPFSK